MTEARIPLRSKDGAVIASAIIDADQYEVLNSFYWHLHPQGYAVRSTRQNGVRYMALMHREILGLEPDDPLCVDHIDRDRLNNRRENLRAVTQAINVANSGPRRLKIAPEANRTMLDLCEQGWQQTDVAVAYGVTQSHVSWLMRHPQHAAQRSAPATASR